MEINDNDNNTDKYCHSIINNFAASAASVWDFWAEITKM